MLVPVIAADAQLVGLPFKVSSGGVTTSRVATMNQR